MTTEPSGGQEKGTAASSWLSEEIFALARLCGIEKKSCLLLKKLVRDLAETAAESRETHLEVPEAEARAFRSAMSRGPFRILAGTPDDFSAGKTPPLIFDEKNSALYLFRHYKQEAETARILSELSRRGERTAPSEAAEKILAAADPFPLNEEQKNAARMILGSRFAMISGGPGTGKTTLLLRTLLCIFTENPNADVRLAAPTGKAAARMAESIRTQADEIPRRGEAGNAFPPEALERTRKLVPATLHGLLRMSAFSLKTPPAPKLSADFIFADEASMIDQAMAHRLLRALSPRSRLVLLGDKNQLDSVGPGHVFGALCAAEPLAPNRAELTRSRRFADEGVLGRFARAVVEGDVPAAAALLEENREEQASRGGGIFHFSSGEISPAKLDAALRELFPKKLQNVPADANPAEMLALLESSRMLTPLRKGEFGAEALNLRARRLFAPAGETRSVGHWHGQPIILTRNAPQESLFNGDTGILLRDPATGTLSAHFRAGDGTLRQIPAALLPEHETAYAMSIHKAQGSEFSRLCVIFPEAHGRAEFFSRQLLYTAATRFRESGNAPLFRLIFDEASLLAAIARKIPLRSLLPQRF